MKVILQKFLNEPVVVVGFLVSALNAYIVAKTASGIDTTGDIVQIVTPFAASIGVRSVVSPTKGE